MRSEHGQASVEWVGLLLLVSIALAATLAFAPEVDGRPLPTDASADHLSIYRFVIPVEKSAGSGS